MSKIAEELANKWRHIHFKGERDCDASGEYLERESQQDIINFAVEDTIARIMEFVSNIDKPIITKDGMLYFLSELEKEYE